jgi:hypothetical protein
MNVTESPELLASKKFVQKIFICAIKAFFNQFFLQKVDYRLEIHKIIRGIISQFYVFLRFS